MQQTAGCKSGFGRVLKREYQLYLIHIRDMECLARKRGQPVEEKPVEQIQREYEAKFGSRFVEI